MRPFLMLVLLATATAGKEQRARPATCEVRPLWVIPGGVGSGRLEPIGKFQPNTDGGVTLRSFKDESLVVTTEFEFVFDYSKKEPYPSAVRAAIAVSMEEPGGKHMFNSPDSSEARTIYHKNWSISVTKNVPVKDRVLMYTLRCWDGSANPNPFL
jgi:hypothetical protein